MATKRKHSGPAPDASKSPEGENESNDTKNYVCAQRGCQFEADEAPETCPTCGHPFVAHPDPDAAHPVE